MDKAALAVWPGAILAGSVIDWRSWSWPRFHRKCWQQSRGLQGRVRMPAKKSVGGKDKTQLQGIRFPRRPRARFNVWEGSKPDIQIKQIRITERGASSKNARAYAGGFNSHEKSHREKRQADDWSDPCLLTAFSFHCPFSSLSFRPSHWPSHWPPILCWNTPILFLFHDFVMLVLHFPELELLLVLVCLSDSLFCKAKLVLTLQFSSSLLCFRTEYVHPQHLSQLFCLFLVGLVNIRVF